ncbi:hypothetical protein GCM10010219_46570 [Streptomyces netropsis]|nr:hypothetical protein GCM10010219_46570 [Streptomyces netropsis]
MPVDRAADDARRTRDLIHARVRVAQQLGERDVHDAAAIGVRSAGHWVSSRSGGPYELSGFRPWMELGAALILHTAESGRKLHTSV